MFLDQVQKQEAIELIEDKIVECEDKNFSEDFLKGLEAVLRDVKEGKDTVHFESWEDDILEQEYLPAPESYYRGILRGIALTLL